MDKKVYTELFTYINNKFENAFLDFYENQDEFDKICKDENCIFFLLIFLPSWKIWVFKSNTIKLSKIKALLIFLVFNINKNDSLTFVKYNI